MCQSAPASCQCHDSHSPPLATDPLYLPFLVAELLPSHWQPSTLSPSCSAWEWTACWKGKGQWEQWTYAAYLPALQHPAAAHTWGNNRCDTLRYSGQHMRYTDGCNKLYPLPKGQGKLVKIHSDEDILLQFLISNDEFLTSASHLLALIMSLPLVHTASSSYRLNGHTKSSDCWRKHHGSSCEKQQDTSLRNRYWSYGTPLRNM